LMKAPSPASMIWYGSFSVVMASGESRARASLARALSLPMCATRREP
jgi:hypothetical protein